MSISIAGSIAALMLTVAPPGEGPGPLVNALWLVQRFGTAEGAAIGHDIQTKGTLAKALKDNSLTAAEMEGLMDPATFSKLAGLDARLTPEEVARALAGDLAPSRARLLPAIRAHADLLTTSFDMIDPEHREASTKLAEWIADHYEPGRALHVSVICTGNSRRSILGATMGNIAASYSGMPEVRFHSGGTAPTAFNPRTIEALKAIGVEIHATGREAPRGEPRTPNPVHSVRWGTGEEDAVEEFSKLYSDPVNPQSGFAALMVCGEADAGCPIVKGAALRVSMPYLDPKIYDGSPFESAKYAERRDDIGRFMLATLLEARRRSGSSRP